MSQGRIGVGSEDWWRGQQAGGAAVSVPPVVYVPVATVTGVGQELQVELRQTGDGGRALLAYTALDRLVECCGPQQPWVVVPTARLEDIGRSAPYELLLLDMPIPDELRHGATDG